MDLSFGKKIVSSEATEEEILHIRTGTLDQVEAIALLRAFDPGASWVRIAFDVKTVASNLRGEPFVRSVLKSGQTPQLMLARTFSDLNNCLISTAMEHISDFLRGNFSIDVPPDYLSVHHNQGQRRIYSIHFRTRDPQALQEGRITSGASSRSSSFNRSCSTGSLKQAPYAIQGSHDYADLLCSSEGHRRPCKGLFFLRILLLLGELMEIFPRPPLRNPTLVCASKTR